MEKQPREPEDIKVNIKLKLAALWTSLMFCYIYGDYFQLFVPGQLDEMSRGRSSLDTPVKLFAATVMLALPAVMICLCTLLKAKLNRGLNIAFGLLYTIVVGLVISGSGTAWMIFYLFLGGMEIILSLLIVALAWKWPGKINAADD